MILIYFYCVPRHGLDHAIIGHVCGGMLGNPENSRGKDVHNKICLNMFMGDDALLLPKDERDFCGA